MKTSWSRREFLGTASAAPALLSFGGAARQSQQPQTMPARRSEPLPDALVNEWVWRGHFDLEGVKRMLSERPTLLNAEFDWGGGDFELAIGGAGHLGRRDIAEYLLSQGARMDIFVATMLGRMDVVKPLVLTYPALLTSKGPHGLTLQHHARQGGAAARDLLEYLQAQGAA
jgi:hypothetical protein